jgi:hypothetical protein
MIKKSKLTRKRLSTLLDWLWQASPHNKDRIQEEVIKEILRIVNL